MAGKESLNGIYIYPLYSYSNEYIHSFILLSQEVKVIP